MFSHQYRRSRIVCTPVTFSLPTHESDVFGVPVIRLSYDKGQVIAHGGEVPYSRMLGEGVYSAPAFRYRDIVDHLKLAGVPFEDMVYGGLEFKGVKSSLKLRDYQQKSLDAWENSGRSGVVVLPTGAGKTVLALKAVEQLGVSALIVVPTLVLVEQWRSRIEEEFGINVGMVGGGGRHVRAVTVATYDSASLKSDVMGNLFKFIIFDEVHHLPASSFRSIGLKYTAPYRMGLTATLNKEDGSQAVLRDLVGDVVWEMDVDELAGSHLAEYTVRTVQVPLSALERGEYDACYTRYRNYLARRSIRIRSVQDYQRFVMRSGRDPEARAALLSRNRAMDIAQNSTSKVEYLKQLLKVNPKDKALIFTRHNKLVYRISKEMLIPAITHQTSKDERERILDGFKSGQFSRIVTSRVLDEGVDVPDASLAVILSGSGSNRQFVQRLGRVLRKSEGKQAKLIELVSKGTAETYTSRRRRG